MRQSLNIWSNILGDYQSWEENITYIFGGEHQNPRRQEDLDINDGTGQGFN